MSRFILATLACLCVSFGTTARAGNIFDFDINGAGGAGTVLNDFTGFDWAPGNALSVGGGNSIGAFIGTANQTVIPGFGTVFTGGAQVPFQLLYHSHVVGSAGDITAVSGAVGPPAGAEYTIVAGFQEVVTSVTQLLNGTFTAQFGLLAGGTNFLEVYYDAVADSNMLAGTGFNDGELVVSGQVNRVISSSFSTPNNLGNVALDQFGGNNYPGIGTVEGGGQTDLRARMNFVNDNFFFGLDPTELNISFVLDSAFDTTSTVPFDSTDPSAAFVFGGGGNGVSPATQAGAGESFFGDPTAFVAIGTVNGNANLGGQSVQFEADANQSFNDSPIVPEPGSMAIWAGALVFAPVLRRRLRKRG